MGNIHSQLEEREVLLGGPLVATRRVAREVVIVISYVGTLLRAFVFLPAMNLHPKP